jgi:hypothetical protein
MELRTKVLMKWKTLSWIKFGNLSPEFYDREAYQTRFLLM